MGKWLLHTRTLWRRVLALLGVALSFGLSPSIAPARA